MNREQNAHAAEPLELGVASVETQGTGWPVAEPEGYRIFLGISDD
jgi:hypothetical protein